MVKPSLLEEVGGVETLEKVHKIFYDKIYVHPWLKSFFEGHNQEAIEGRQTSFMAEKMGGPKEYMGKPLRMAHRQMYITEELFLVRRELLRDSLREFGLSEALIERWLKIDSAFKKQMVKDSVETFYKDTFKYERRVIVPKPIPFSKDG